MFVRGHRTGVNKGRILKFSTRETLHGEVTEKNGKLHIVLLDKEMKPLTSFGGILSATAGTRAAPENIAVELPATGFVLAAPVSGQWLILQYRPEAAVKAVTAGLHFETKTCAPCGQPEWRCVCAAKK